MALISFNRKTFEKEIGKLDEKMQTRIAMFGNPIEGIDDKGVQIEVFPNRPDLLSYQGFKRAFLGFLGKKTGLKEYKLNPGEKNYHVIIDKSVTNVRPFTACAIVKGLKLDDEKIKEIIDLQEKLHTTLGRKRKKVAIGIYPMEKIKLPITFKALEPDKIKFIPLDSEKEMSGLEILQRHPAGKEYAHLLAGKEKFPVFVDAEEKVLSMPPIINSELTGKITESTKDVFVECSGFDLEILKKTLNILVTTLSDMGAKIYQMELKYGKKEITPDLKPEEMKISVENANKLLGLNLNEKQIKNFLGRMGYNYEKGKVKVPAWRVDILHEVDLIEDIAIAYGFENFVPEIPEISTMGEEDGKEIIKRKISEILQGLGFLELLNYHLTNRDMQFEKMSMPEKEFVSLEESKTDYNILRKDLSHYLLKILSENSDSEYPQKTFEIGRVFEYKNEISEKENFALAVSPGNFTDVKQAIEYLGKMLNIDFDIKETENHPQYFIDGRVGKIIFDGKEIGLIGEIHPKVLRNWKIKMPVSIFEIDLESIFEKLI
ncbi:phenylalanine--tRNA ligase subunit beta [Candidatus Pacearchaeota archaeon]|nr:phenylalanine--tRNA ligase subunit beta [Candidatus Pacearchaeota archaeon]